VGWVVIALIVAYLLFRVWLWAKGRMLSAVPFAAPADAARDMAAGALVYDVRSHGYFDPKATRIRGLGARSQCASSVRSGITSRRNCIVYCTCVRQATSTRVARELQKTAQGKRVRVIVIQGGLRAWVKAGLPVEGVPPGEMARLPVSTKRAAQNRRSGPRSSRPIHFRGSINAMLASSKLQTIVLSSPLLGVAKVTIAQDMRVATAGARGDRARKSKSASLLSYSTVVGVAMLWPCRN